MAHADARAPVARDAAIDGAKDDAIDTFIFDLDGTLYPITNGYEHACRARVFSFMVNRIGGFASESHAKDVWWSAFQRYNQTLRSLRALGYDAFDAEEYWAYTRGDAREFLKPNAETRAFVEALRGKKFGACDVVWWYRARDWTDECTRSIYELSRDASAPSARGFGATRLFRRSVRRRAHG